MKLESLTVIFLVIIIPISMVLSQYINRRIQTERIEIEYNTKLLNSTFDAIKAYQLNTVNNSFGDDANAKVSDLEAAANTFYNSLATNFNFIGTKRGAMKDYVPAIAFTLYDGFYIHSPYTNTLVDVEEIDEGFSKKDEKTEGLKPYIYYSCRYKYDNSDFIITYTLDNYITIQGYIGGFDEDHYVYDAGYLMNGIAKSGEKYTIGNTTITKNNTEELKEYVGNTEYPYVKINGVKYYLANDNEVTDENAEEAKIFYIDSSGQKNFSQFNNEPENIKKLYNAIKHNKSAYEYYKNAYEFRDRIYASGDISKKGYIDKSGKEVKFGYNLINLNSSDAVFVTNPDSNNITHIPENVYIFQGYREYNLQWQKSNFNQHRRAVIRYIIETNLISAISNYSTGSGEEYVMPKISEDDWELIQDEPCAISFMQGMVINSKIFNSYKVVQNTLSKEHVDENDIYLLTTDNTYVRVTDNGLTTPTNSFIKIKEKSTLGYYAGIWKLNFEKKIDRSEGEEIPYVPMSYKDLNNQVQGYIGSYTSIMGSSGIEYNNLNNLYNGDMYEYVKKGINPYSSNPISAGEKNRKNIETAYFYALGRERHGAFNINNINYELYGSNTPEKYFLKDYE